MVNMTYDAYDSWFKVWLIYNEYGAYHTCIYAQFISDMMHKMEGYICAKDVFFDCEISNDICFMDLNIGRWVVLSITKEFHMHNEA